MANGGHGSLLVEDFGVVRNAILCNEERSNALSRSMVSALRDAIRSFAEDDALRVLIIRGSGDAAFSAGADLKELEVLRASGKDYTPVMPSLFQDVLELEKPVVAAVNGDAVGGGLELALCCDFRVARDGVRVGLPEMGLGMVPRFGTALLARRVSINVALDLVLTGRLLSTDEAAALHLISSRTSSERFEDQISALAERLASLSPIAVRAVKYIAQTPTLPLSGLVSAVDPTGHLLPAASRRVAAEAEQHDVDRL
jgi:enoyl-CoA hydratase